MKRTYAKTALIGLAIFGAYALWALYNVFVPIILNKTYGLSASIVGIFMSLDNLAAFLIQPAVGAWSDRTRTRIGRRMPFILIGAPISALMFGLIPLTAVLPLAMPPVRAMRRGREAGAGLGLEEELMVAPSVGRVQELRGRSYPPQARGPRRADATLQEGMGQGGQRRGSLRSPPPQSRVPGPSLLIRSRSRANTSPPAHPPTSTQSSLPPRDTARRGWGYSGRGRERRSAQCPPLRR